MGELADILLPTAAGPQGAFYWANVTSINPLQVRLDGETVPLNIKPVSLVSNLVVGDRVWCQLNKRQLLIIKGTNDRRDLWMRNMGLSVTGATRRTASSTAIAWDGRFILMGNGRSRDLAPSGFWDMSKPADGTVIPVIGVNGMASVTVASGVVPLGAWFTLWYDIAPSGKTALGSRWVITGYNDTDFEVPSTWIRIATRNMDLGGTIIWGDGRETALWIDVTGFANGWSNYGSGYVGARYKRENGQVYIQGLIKSGTVGSAGCFTLPAGYRPSGTLQWPSNSSGGLADIRLFSTGVFCVYALYSGTNASVSISVPPWFPDL